MSMLKVKAVVIYLGIVVFCATTLAPILTEFDTVECDMLVLQ